MILPLWKTVGRFLKKPGVKPPNDSAIPLLGIYTEETRVGKDTCIPLFVAALFTIVRTWKQPRCPSTDEWIKKLWYIHTMEYYLAIKNQDTVGEGEVGQIETYTFSSVQSLSCVRLFVTP